MFADHVVARCVAHDWWVCGWHSSLDFVSLFSLAFHSMLATSKTPLRQRHAFLPLLFQRGASESMAPARTNRPTAQDWFGGSLRFIVLNFKSLIVLNPGAWRCNTSPAPAHNYLRCKTGFHVITNSTVFLGAHSLQQ